MCRFPLFFTCHLLLLLPNHKWNTIGVSEAKGFFFFFFNEDSEELSWPGNARNE